MRYSGTLRDCIGRYTKIYGNTEQSREPIVVFTGGSDTSVKQNWLTLKHPPTACRFLKLIYFFYLNDCNVEELSQVDHITKELGLIIALQVIEYKEAAEYLDYTPWSFRQAILSPSSRVRKERQDAMRELCEMHRDEYTASLRKFKKISEILGGPGLSLSPQEVKLMGGMQDTETGNMQSQTVIGELKTERGSFHSCRENKSLGETPDSECVAGDTTIGDNVLFAAVLLGAVSPILRHIREQEGGQGVSMRKRLRELLGPHNSVFAIANTLNALCGEKARAKLDSSKEE